ncbi:hypothetical protein [Bifidobacterium saimiriisciurei]|uniref:hypothetical protein n=1 Tax=Bifidobacterium saimiriisciurei TaxID=2661627 RepID=UPI001CDC7373|nr:hypothetical protein [Bifidobacterium saimiriisciurei]
MSVSEFTNDEITYLRSLRAVARVANGRIRYTEAFKRDCMRRYAAGESPAKIFRDAGLDSSLIGYKRIERCIARWRGLLTDKSLMTQASGADAQAAGRNVDGSAAGAGAEAPDTATAAGSYGFAAGDSSAHRGDAGVRHEGTADDDAPYEFEPKLHVRSGRRDLRDLLIAQQVRRIDELEHEVVSLKAALLDEGRTRTGFGKNGDDASDGGAAPQGAGEAADDGGAGHDGGASVSDASSVSNDGMAENGVAKAAVAADGEPVSSDLHKTATPPPYYAFNTSENHGFVVQS